ncbi:MAG: FecR domain-containing protein [Armatimonadetes bacterium]|nr:FecR domain-containing protein [Armatimonadota bacterium]
MQCKYVQERLEEYREDLLSMRERAEFIEHLSSCDLCRQALERANRLTSLVKGIPEKEPPAGLVSGILSRLPAKPRPVAESTEAVSPRRSLWIPLARAAVVLLMLTGAWFFGERISKPSASLAGIPQIDTFRGSVLVTPRDRPGPVVPVKGRFLSEGDRLETRADSQAFLTLGEGTRARLEKDGILFLLSLSPSDPSHSVHVYLVKGELEVFHSRHPLLVTTPQAFVTPVGTRFRVVVKDSETTVRVLEGAVAVQRKAQSGPGVTIRSGEETVVSRRTPLPPPDLPPQGGGTQRSPTPSAPESPGPDQEIQNQ